MISPCRSLFALAAIAAACGQPDHSTHADESTQPPHDAAVSTSTADGGMPSPGAPATSAPASTDPVLRGCAPIALAAGMPVDGTPADTFTWYDAHCEKRSASILRNDAPDAFGQRGGYLRAYTYAANGKQRDIRGSFSAADGWNGFGYLVNHYADSYSDNKRASGSFRTVLSGPHHAVHELKVRVSPGGAVDATVHWVFATGRSHPLFAVTFDATPAGENKLRADTRAPYGDLRWDDGKGQRVDGLGWGDARKLALTSALSATASWDYQALNVVPHAFEFSTATDAEMGLVATQSFAARPQGGDYGGGALDKLWGKTGAQLLRDIPDWQWPFQLNQYELPAVDSSHRLAWGAPYGAVGQRAYQAFGKTLSGFPYQSYTVAVVLGTHGASAVATQVAEVEAALATRITATRGTVATRGAAGAGRSDEATFDPPGWDPTYAAFTADLDQGAATLRIQPGAAPLRTPLFVLRGNRAAQGPARVTLDGVPLQPDVDYFASADPAGARLWLTLNRTLEGASTLAVE